MQQRVLVISGLVTLCHCVGIFPLFWAKNKPAHTFPTQKISVQTYTLPEAKPCAPKKIEQIAQTAAKTLPPKKEPPQKKNTKALIASLEKNLKQLNSSSQKLASTSKLAIPKLSIEMETRPQDADHTSYIEELTDYLKTFLILPETGKVKVKLTLLRSGIVSKIAIVFSESNANYAYVEKRLPTLRFPPFRDQKERTLTLTLEGKISA